MSYAVEEGAVTSKVSKTVPTSAVPRNETLSLTTPSPFSDRSTSTSSVMNTYNPLDVWETNVPTQIQGGSIRTWTFDTPLIQTVQVHLRTEGRPMNANVELWQGPDNTPQQIAIYTEDGKLRPFACFMNTPFSRNSISIRNTASLEYPPQSILEPSPMPSTEDDSILATRLNRFSSATPKLVQGGAALTFPISSDIKSVQLLLQMEERPLHCHVKLLSGPNNVKQVMEVYSEDGHLRPFYAIVQTPDVGNVIRIVNTATIEFPIMAIVEAWEMEGEEQRGNGVDHNIQHNREGTTL